MCNSSCYNQKFRFTPTPMAQFDRVQMWSGIDGLTNLLLDCGMPEGHPWFEQLMQIGTHFCGRVAGVDSVFEMVERGFSAKFIKAVKAEFPEFPKAKQVKLREVLAVLRADIDDSAMDTSSTSSGTSKRGRKSKFSDEAEIEWLTAYNPHKHGSDRWCMWEVAFEAKNRSEFLSREGIRSPIEGREAIRKPHAGYFSHLVDKGYIVIKA